MFFVVLALPVIGFGAPRIQLPEDQWKIGGLYQGGSAEHTLVVGNVGKETLLIRQIRSSCPECTALLGEGKRIEPGKWGLLKVVYHAKARPGRYTPFFDIETNDPIEPVKRFQLSVTVLSPEKAPALTCSPAKLDLGILAKHEMRPVEIAVSNSKRAEATLIIKRIHTSAGVRTKTALPLKIQPKGAAVLSFEVDAGESGILSKSVSLASNDPVRPVVAIPIIGYVAGKDRRGEQAPGAEIRAGLVIRPIGEPLTVPGTGGVLVRQLLVGNGTSDDLKIAFPIGPGALAEAEPKSLNLKPGAEGIVKLRVRPEQIGKTATIPIRLDYPVIVKRRAGAGE